VLARTNPGVIVLSGRIAIGRGDLDAAADAFARAREIEPNNVEAVIGTAELALARGQSAEARANLERALRLNPDQRKALLSLVLIYEYLGEDDVAEQYLDLARSVHRDRPEVHILAAEYYLRAGELSRAAAAARTAQALDAGNRAALTLRARIAIAESSYLEAVAIAEQLISTNRNDVFAWYARALAKYRLGELADAVTSIRTALRIEPDNELLRIWAEWLALEELELDDPVRAELASVRAEDARVLERAFRYQRALRAYRRALQLAPLDLTIRRRYAELLHDMGFDASYLQELGVLRENGLDDPDLALASEVYENALRSSVSSRWGVDQFTLTRSLVPIGLYLRDLESDSYPDAAEAVLSFVERTLQGEGRVEVVDARAVPGFSEAFAFGRASSAHFYLDVEAAITERMSGFTAGIHVSRTGSLAAQRTSVRTGPDHAAAAVDALAVDVTGALPVSASIIRRQSNRVVVDVGRRDGIAAGDVFDVVRPGDLTVAASEPRYVYREQSVLARITITAVDDLLSEGTLERVGVVDLVTVGDRAVAVSPESESGSSGGSSRSVDIGLFPVLYERVRRLQ
jgi:tetratricopeptide (TPR) repeat protein